MREQEHLCMIYPISNTYLDIKEREQEAGKAEWTRKLSERDRKERDAQRRGAKRITRGAKRTRLKAPFACEAGRRRVLGGDYERERGRGDLERQKLPLDLIACTSAFKWLINYT